ncbi:MAG: insulinase family protein [Isosphaeraceae bacterium]
MLRYLARLLAALLVVLPPSPLVTTPPEPFEPPRIQVGGRRVLRPVVVPPIRVPLTLVPSKSTPLLAVRLVVQVGSTQDPPGKEGLAALTGMLLAHGGIRGATHEQILERLYPLAASIQVECGKESTAFLATMHRDNFDRLIPTLAAILVMPRLDPEDFKRIRNDVLARLDALRTENEVDQLASEILEARIFQGHPYGHSVLGNRASIEAITLDDVTRFFREHYNRDTLRIGMAGGTASFYVDALRSQLGGIPQATARRSYRIPEVPRREGLEVTIVEASTSHCAITLGFPIEVHRAHADFSAVRLAVAALDAQQFGSLSSPAGTRLTSPISAPAHASMEVAFRSETVDSTLTPEPRSRPHFALSLGGVRPDQAARMLSKTLAELDRFVAEGLSGEQLDAVQCRLENTTTLGSRRLDKALGLAMARPLLGRADESDEAGGTQGSASRDEVNAAIRRHLAPRGIQVVIVSPQALASKMATDVEAALRDSSTGESTAGSPAYRSGLRVKVLKAGQLATR